MSTGQAIPVTGARSCCTEERLWNIPSYSGSTPQAGRTGSQALQALAAGAAFPQPDPRMINNHIHTTYSFSPYSPAAAIYGAREAGLCTAGIIDHDSVGGAWEFMEAGKLAGIPTTVGVELRVRFDETPFLHRRTNNPDQDGLSYMLIHGIPHENLSKVQAWFAPLREARNLRNQKMVDRINRLYGPQGVSLDFARDVLPLSMYHDGGTVTERHLMLALAGSFCGCRAAPRPSPAPTRPCWRNSIWWAG